MAYQEGLERNEALLPFRELVFFPLHDVFMADSRPEVPFLWD